MHTMRVLICACTMLLRHERGSLWALMWYGCEREEEGRERVCVCVCVRERERKRERERERERASSHS